MKYFDDYILQEEIELYDNMAASGSCVGRLKVIYYVQPVPRIYWEFESIGANVCEPDRTSDRLVEPLVGNWIRINDAYPSFAANRWSPERSRMVMRGGAPNVLYGSEEEKSYNFHFYLSNGRFQTISLASQKALKSEEFIEHDGKKEMLKASVGLGRVLKTKFANGWTLELIIEKESYDLLSNNNMATGVYITTLGRYYFGDNWLAEQTSSEGAISLSDASNSIFRLTQLLSFANGGITAPLIIEVFDNSFRDFYPTVFSADLVTPIEQLGYTWLMLDSDLCGFINCYETFEKMLQSSVWSSRLGTILMWYFEAIQPTSHQVPGKPWPVVAVALGALLELLFHIICVDEEENEKEKTINKKKVNQDQIRYLLNRIGIDSVNFEQTSSGEDLIYLFNKLRNEAAHPEERYKLKTEEAIVYILEQAKQWVEEVILWRIGYSGKYRDRFRNGNRSTEPRYDLSTRNPSW